MAVPPVEKKGLTLRTSHDPLPFGATVSNRRLTIEEMDNNFIFLQSLVESAVLISRDQANLLINTSEVVPGQSYIITNAHLQLYGSNSPFNFGDGTYVLVRGLDSTHFSSGGWGKFYNPIYNGDYSVWDDGDHSGPSATYSPGDIVIYGGRVWMKTSDTGYSGSLDLFTLDTDWTAQNYQNTLYYNVVWDEIEYDLYNDFIVSRYNIKYNNYVKQGYDTWSFNGGYYPIQVFRWGHGVGDNGVSSCNVINSYFECLNFINGSMFNIDLSNNSAIYGMYLANGSQLSQIKISDGSYMGHVYLDSGSYMNNITISGDSGISGERSNELWLTENSYFSDITIENNSYIRGYLHLGEGSYFESVSISNGSRIDGGNRNNGDSVNNRVGYNFGMFFSFGSNLQSVKITNNSYIGEGAFWIWDGYMYDITLNNDSRITGYLVLHNSALGSLNLDNHSKFGRGNNNSSGNSGSIELYSYSAIEYLDMSNAVVDGYLYMDGGLLQQVKLVGPPNPDDGRYDYVDGGGSSHANNYNFNITNGITLGCGIEIHQSYIMDLEVTNGSFFGGYDTDSYEIYIEGNSWMRGIKLDNGSIMSRVYLYQSQMEYIEVTNGSYIYNIELDSHVDGSSITYLTVNNNSFFGDYIYLFHASMQFIEINNNSQLQGSDWGYGHIYLYNYSFMENIKISNYSQITGWLRLYNSSYFTLVTLDNYSQFWGTTYMNIDSRFENVSLQNGSSIINIDMEYQNYISYMNLTNESYIDGVALYDHSNIQHGELSNSSIESIMLNSSSTWYGMFLKQSGIVAYTPDGQNELYNLQMTGTYLYLNDSSSIYKLDTLTGQYNTFKHQFAFDFYGDSGRGATGSVAIPLLFVPNTGWYIEKVLIDSTNIVSNSTSTLSIGLSEDNNSGMNSIDTSLLNNMVKVYDISNGGSNGVKSASNGSIQMVIGNDAITSGNIKVEITLKNTNYSNSND